MASARSRGAARLTGAHACPAVGQQPGVADPQRARGGDRSARRVPRRAGRRLCVENERCKGKHAELFARWEQDRTKLDEEVNPKKMVCFESEYNHRLAEGLDVEAVYYAER